MPELTTEVLIKLVGTVVAGLIVLIVIRLWDRLRNSASRMFGTVPVGGKWITKIERGGRLERHEEVKLHQFVCRVWGTQTAVEGPSRTYRVRGYLRGQTLTLLYEQSSGGGFETGVILLTANADGKSMEGYEIEYDTRTKGVTPSRYVWER